MNELVFALVIASALFQALWNFAAKRTKGDRLSLICTGWLLSGLLVILFAWLSGREFPTSPNGWGLLLISGAINAIYVLLLERAYHYSDFSMAYPLARGTGVFLTAVLAVGIGGEQLSAVGLIGIGLILIGILSVAWSGLRQKVGLKVVAICLTIGFLAACYSIIDKFGVQYIDPVWYLGVLNSLPALMLLPFFRPRTRIVAFDRKHSRDIIIIAIGATFSYLVILWALKTTSTAYVTALRETSILFAAVMGFLVLREKMDWPRALGVVLILAGAIFLRSA